MQNMTPLGWGFAVGCVLLAIGWFRDRNKTEARWHWHLRDITNRYNALVHLILESPHEDMARKAANIIRL